MKNFAEVDRKYEVKAEFQIAISVDDLRDKRFSGNGLGTPDDDFASQLVAKVVQRSDQNLMRILFWLKIVTF